MLRCEDRPERPVRSEHDLALLEYGPLEVPSLSIAWERSLPPDAWLVGWHRRPPTRGRLHRYAGAVRVLGLRGGVLVVESKADDESDAFGSRRGNSGGPALAHSARGLEILGVLSRLTLSSPRRSFHAPTFTPANRSWLREELTREGNGDASSGG